jgi:hypothetical protein
MTARFACAALDVVVMDDAGLAWSVDGSPLVKLQMACPSVRTVSAVLMSQRSCITRLPLCVRTRWMLG